MKGNTVMVNDANVPPMQIGEVAERTGLSFRTLRHYDDIGLLRPTGRSDGGFRLYTTEDVDKLLVIRRMKPLGFSLEQMHDVMGLIETLRDPSSDPSPKLRARHAAIVDEATERRERLLQQLSMADEFIDLLKAQLRQ